MWDCRYYGSLLSLSYLKLFSAADVCSGRVQQPRLAAGGGSWCSGSDGVLSRVGCLWEPLEGRSLLPGHFLVSSSTLWLNLSWYFEEGVNCDIDKHLCYKVQTFVRRSWFQPFSCTVLTSGLRSGRFWPTDSGRLNLRLVPRLCSDPDQWISQLRYLKSSSPLQGYQIMNVLLAAFKGDVQALRRWRPILILPHFIIRTHQSTNTQILIYLRQPASTDDICQALYLHSSGLFVSTESLFQTEQFWLVTQDPLSFTIGSVFISPRDTRASRTWMMTSSIGDKNRVNMVALAGQRQRATTTSPELFWEEARSSWTKRHKRCKVTSVD